MLRDSAGAGAPLGSPSSTSSSTSPSSSRFAAAAAGSVPSADSTIAAASKSKSQSQTQKTLADSLRALRGNSSRESLHGSGGTSGSRRKAAPSPLQHSASEQNHSGYSSSVSSPRLPVSPLQSPLASPRFPDERAAAPQAADMTARQLSSASTAASTARDGSKSGPALQSDTYGSGGRKASAPIINSAQLSPPQTPNTMTAPASKPSRLEPRPAAARNVSLDSTTSSISSEPQSARSTSSTVQRAPQEQASSSTVGRSNSNRDKVEHKDLGSYIASVGSPQAALEALWREKQSSSQHTAQLWRLVEKQREMILGLNKDLERAGKDKERYRKKLKEHLAQKPLLPNGVQQRNDSALSRVHSQSPAPSEQYDPAGRESAASEQRSMALLRSDSNLSGTTGASESPTDTKPSGAAALLSSSPPSRNVAPTTPSRTERTPSLRQRNDNAASSPRSSNAQDLHPSPRHIKPHGDSKAPTVSLTQPTPIMGNNMFAGPASNQSPTTGFHKHTTSRESTSSMKSASMAASPTSTRKKPPPAPLDLSKPHATSVHLHQQHPGERSDSDYDDMLDEGDDIPPIMRDRGRRKTREEDDALREAIAKSEERSKSTKKKSKSKVKPAGEGMPPQPTPQVVDPQPQPQPQHQARSQAPAPAPPVPGLGFVGLPASPRLPPPDAAGSINALLSPAASDSSGRTTGRGVVPGFQGTPPLLSPGLPLSPRPVQANGGLQPVGLPMSPRAGKTTFAGAAPLSPRPGVGVGMASVMPLSPRAPRSAIPLPPTSPLGANNPHLQRAEQHAQGSDSLAARMAMPTTTPSESGSMARSHEHGAMDGVYHGLKDDAYPGLLLPPNALPSIDAKVYSSRMRPSRNSILFAKPDEDPVFQLGIYAHSSGRQLWRVEKTTSALAHLHDVVIASTEFGGILPERGLFVGHAPAKIDARRAALNEYFDVLLDTEMHERTALEVCSFFSEDVIEPEHEDGPMPAATITNRQPPQQQLQQHQQQQHQPAAVIDASRQPRQKYRKEGYLTKKGKNFGGWKARYFVLDGSSLTYLDAPGGEEIGRIKLANAQIGKQQQTAASTSRSPSVDTDANPEDNEYRHAFLVLEPKRKDESALVRHVLCAESDAERDAWVAALLLYVEPSESGQSQQPQLQSQSQSQASQERQKSTRGRKIVDRQRPTLQQRAVENEARPTSSRGHESSRTPSPEPERPQLVKGYSYDNMPQQQEPQRGGNGSNQTQTQNRQGLPSPPLDGSFHAHDNKHIAAGKPISGPSGAMKIQDASLWGNKTPTAKDHKKRSIFGFRGRAPSDLAPGMSARSHPHPGAGHAVFGVPLAEAVDFTKPFESEEPLPSVVYRCIEYLRENDAVEEEGIFRLSGSNVTIKALKDRFNTEGDVRLLEGDYYDINAVASLLKAYLRELPVSVLTRELHLDFLNVLKHDDVDKVKAFNVLIHRLPPENRALVSALSQFLIEIVDNQDRNKMNVRNIAIVFGPTLNIPGPIITAFLTDYDAIFGDSLAEEQASPIRETLVQTTQQTSEWDGIRSPRHQMFSDLPTPAYNQTGFQNVGGFAPMQQGPPGRYPPQQQQQQQQRGMAGFPQADYQYPQPQQQQFMTQVQPSQDGYGSLNAALGQPPSLQPQQQQQQRLQVDERQLRKSKRESNIHMLSGGAGGASLAEMMQQQRMGSYHNGRHDGSSDRKNRSPARQF